MEIKKQRTFWFGAVALSPLLFSYRAGAAPGDAIPAPAALFPIVNTLVVEGDSITVGVGASSQTTTGWPARLSELIERYQKTPVKIVNVAVSRTDAIAQQANGPQIAAQKPDLLCILLGINDLRQARPVTEYTAAMDKLICDIKKGAPEATIVLGSPTWMETYVMADPQWARWAKGNRQIHLSYREAVRALAAKDGCLFADTYAAMEGKPQLIPDTVHPNDLGYQLIADRFFEALVLGRAPATNQRKQ